MDRDSTVAHSAGRSDPLLDDRADGVVHLLGNDAIVRGAIEAGVVFVAGYPGTPSSEITDGFARISKAREIAFEYSVNEKIALELAFAAALAGARSLTAMKHLGLMVAGDPISTIPYVGVEAGMVVISAGDRATPAPTRPTNATSVRCCTCPSSIRARPPKPMR